ncbi:hypothetical protein FJQ98_26285 [Lysinibacillus agricola]|uniref:Uncharacterized protein n=1 Tax=Lysinibacillus agricola TaxID=2590012 RepID=A0ABX7ATL9_9BACI|nr:MULTISPECIES: hypothetical protein [Lysinibacillus]KOS61097.1 hypothetical protein AN161_19125 [Lysinibacillus sp. FJAT-14222]QQP12530.1 hypothetical protein FJQ98_26285 [Lysinibacillus agricola]
MKNPLLSKLVTAGVLSLGISIASFSSAHAAELEDTTLPDTSVIGSDAYVAPELISKGPDVRAWTATVSYGKRYTNLYGINVATQLAYIQWTYDSGKITKYNNLWQDNNAAIGYGYGSESNTWNLKGTSSGQANQSVKFDSGIPTPWGHVGGPSFTSRIITDITGSGNSSAY